MNYLIRSPLKSTQYIVKLNYYNDYYEQKTWDLDNEHNQGDPPSER